MTTAHLLVVDDEPNTRKTLRRALELSGYSVSVAESVAEARTKFRERDPDLCLLDVRLPDGDGITLLGELRKNARPPEFIMMSGDASIDDAVKAIGLGARDFLEKPIGQDRLLLTIENALKLRNLEVENAELKERSFDDEELLGRSPAMKELLANIESVAPTEGRVLITGENGTGKELVARAIHRRSARANKPFVSLNSAAVPSELIESELFGHEKGSFTGAIRQKAGKFELAHRGTLFLDEIGDTPLAMQAKLLRVLEAQQLERVGGSETIDVDVRVIAATNKDLEEEIREGRFREDLYYRLNVVPLVTPPLRDRRSDIPILAERFLADAAKRNHRRPKRLTDAAMARIAAHDYPGNVRELRNLMERIVILAPAALDVLDEPDLARLLPGTKRETPTVYRSGVRLMDLVEEAERAIIVEALREHDGVVAETARALGVERSNFHKKLKALGIRAPTT